MDKIPEEAVKAPERIRVAQDAEGFWTCREAVSGSTEYVRADLALPHLPGVGVKKLEWTRGVVDIASPHPGMKYVACSTTPKGSWAFWLDHAPETRSVFTSEEAAKAAAQADYEARILSALEPSAARERALEEGYRQGIEAAAKLIECGCKALLHGKGECQFPGNCSLEDAAAIRALSSPDHSDAGKVEGDGWLPIESALDHKQGPFLVTNNPKALNAFGRPSHVWCVGSIHKDDDGSFCAFDGYRKIHDLKMFAVVSAPSQEVAGS